MKLALSIALLGLFAVAALARTDIQRNEFKFTPGKIQTYEYRGRLVNGIPKLANQYSGLQVECKVVVEPVNEQQIVMKLDNIRVSELPHHHNVEHYERIGSDSFETIYTQNKELTEEYQGELVKPIRFTYYQGKVQGFEADVNEAEWSVNMKKSILALFQLDLTPSKIIKSDSIRRLSEEIEGRYEAKLLSTIVDPITGERHLGQYSPEEVISQTSAMPLVYPIYEESFQGTCETKYQVDSVENVDQLTNNYEQRANTDITVLNVTKTINFKNCLTDPSVSYDQHIFHSKASAVASWQQAYLNKQRLARYNTVPEEIKSKYSNVFTSTEAKNNVASPIPVDRYSFIKYNITQNSQTGLSVIEGVLAEGKIKYQADGDELVSISHQKLKLLYVAEQQERSSNLLAKFQQIGETEYYTTIQCEMSQQKMKNYQNVMRAASSYKRQQQQQQLQKQQQYAGLNKQTTTYSGEEQSKVMPPFANSASWYSLVADEDDEELSTDPEELTKQVEQLLKDLVKDVQSDIVSIETKKAGHRVVQIVHIIANLPTHKLAEVYERIVARLTSSGSQRRQSTYENDFTEATITSRAQESEEEFAVKIMRKLFLDSLPLAGTKSAISFIVQLIENKRVSAWEAKELVESCPTNIRYPDKEVIDAFVRLSQSPFVREHQTLKMSTSIACAKMIANAYARSKDLSFKSTVYEKVLPVHLREDMPTRMIAQEADPRVPEEQTLSRQQQIIVKQQQELAEDDEDVKLISEKDILKYVQIFKGMLEKSRNYHDRVTYIETLAHMKVPQVMPVLQPYISGRISLNQCLNSKDYQNDYTINQHQRQQHQYRSFRQQQQQQQTTQSLEQQLSAGGKNWSDKDGKDAEECNFLRTVAIYACAHIARTHSGQVLPMVLPVFDNTYEPYQIRIAAFTVATLDRDLDDVILERIASQMWREPSKQVASFVVGTLDTLANMTNPKMSKIAYVARKACESMPKEYLNTWRYSWLMGGDHYNNEIEQGFSWISELVKSNVSSVPRAGYFHFGHSHGPAAQNYDNKIELGWTAKGLEQFMDEYLAEEEGSILATLIQQVFASSEDIEQYYENARDTLFKQQQQYTQQTGEGQLFKNARLAAALGRSAAATEEMHQSRQTARKTNKQSERSFGSKQQQQQQQEQYFSRDGQSYSWESSQEEPKLALFAKLFDQTAYLALDKQQMKKMARDFDDYITEMGQELIMGSKLSYVKMVMPNSMWQMVPSQIGMPVFVTHRKPIIVSVTFDGTTAASATGKQQQQQQPISANKWSRWTATNSYGQQQLGLDHVSFYVHPKIIHSNYRFMFTVDQAQKVAYGVQTEKSHQVSLPVIMSAGYSQPRQIVSFALAPIFLNNQQQQRVDQQLNQFWSCEVAKTFVGDLKLVHSLTQQQQQQSWLGDEKIIRSKSTDNIRSPVDVSDSQMRSFQRAYNQKWLGLELVINGVSDDDEFDWTFNMEDKNQHSKSGPFSHILHIVDALTSRPSKYQEYFGYLRPDQAHKEPVYKFEVALQKPINFVQQLQQVANKQQQMSYIKQQQYRSKDVATLQGGIRSQQQQAQQPIKHTAVIRLGENQICFSVTPVSGCPKNSTPIEFVQVDTPFTCLSAASGYPVAKLVDEAEYSVLHQMEDKKVTLVRPHVQARMCSVY